MVMPSPALASSLRSVTSGSNCRMICTVPPACSTGLAYRFSPPVWKNGSTFRNTSSRVILLASMALTALKKTMP